MNNGLDRTPVATAVRCPDCGCDKFVATQDHAGIEYRCAKCMIGVAFDRTVPHSGDVAGYRAALEDGDLVEAARILDAAKAGGGK